MRKMLMQLENLILTFRIYSIKKHSILVLAFFYLCFCSNLSGIQIVQSNEIRFGILKLKHCMHRSKSYDEKFCIFLVHIVTSSTIRTLILKR